jgi:hypothetical protein
LKTKSLNEGCTVLAKIWQNSRQRHGFVVVSAAGWELQIFGRVGPQAQNNKLLKIYVVHLNLPFQQNHKTISVGVFEDFFYN